MSKEPVTRPIGQAHVEQREEDLRANQARGDTTTSTSADAEAAKRQHEQRDKELEQLNEQNQEGHEKNMKAIEEQAKATEEASKTYVPTGKEDNRNTPKVMPDGRKVWT